MKIAFLHTDFRIYWPARLNALANELLKNGHSYFVVEISGKGSPYEFAKNNNIPSYWHLLYPSTAISDINTKELKQTIHHELDEINPDVIIAGAIAFPSGANAVSWAKKNKKKVIIFDDARIEDVQRNFVVNFIKKSIYKCVDAIIYPAEPWLETAYFWGFKKKQVFYGIDVVDNDFWRGYGNGRTEKGNYIIAVGRMIPKKNFIYLLQEYKSYLDQCENTFDLLLIGDGIEKERLKQFVIESRLESKVHFLEFQTQERLRELYHNAACSSSSSEYETWGLVINEAMACGLPIIASIKCGATSTLVKDGFNGYTFDPFEKGALCSKLIAFHNLSDKKKEEMGKHSSSIISEWGLERFVSGCCDAIDFVINAPYQKPSFISRQIINKWKGRYRPI